jgi:hypothetical protein
MRFNVLLLIIFLQCSVQAACPEFETALQKAATRYQTRVVEATAKKAKENAFSTPEVRLYKERYSHDFALPANSNARFMALAKADQAAARSNVVYFDIENSIQKKLNDQIFGEKTMVDSVNNSLMERFYKHVQDNPALKSRLNGQYKDYKSLRLRLELKTGDNRAEYEKMLADTYQRSAQEFKVEFDRLHLQEIVNPRTDTVPVIDRWFLAGTGDTPVSANMAARGARANIDKGILHYQDHIPTLHKDVLLIEELRNTFSKDKGLLDLHILEKLPDGHIIPTKDMIGILRKIKPSSYNDDAEYLAKIHEQVRKMFGKDISDENIHHLTNYFATVDSLSPPLFSAERIEINLGEATKGIVSIDFTGVGVDNAYQQMSALARLNYKQTDQAMMLKQAFGDVQTHVDQVTVEMNNSKKFFSAAVKKVNEQNHAPMFSGDDGIFMPKTDLWNINDKKKLVQELGHAADPSKFRVTFVNSTYTNGEVVSVEARSALIVKAEKFEKKLRAKLIGVDGISSEEAQKIITAIDFVPTTNGGTFKVLAGGKTLSAREQQLLLDAAQKSIDPQANEVFGGLELVSGT